MPQVYNSNAVYFYHARHIIVCTLKLFIICTTSVHKLYNPKVWKVRRGLVVVEQDELCMCGYALYLVVVPCPSWF